MTKKYYWDPVKKVLDVVQIFLSKPQPPEANPPPRPPVPPPIEGTPTQKLFPPQPPPGDTTRFYGSPPKSAPPAEPPTRRMTAPPEKLPPASPRPGAGRLDRFKPLGSRLTGDETLRGVPKDKIFSKEELRLLEKAGRKSWWSRLSPRGKIGLGLATVAGVGLIGFAAETILMAGIDYALDWTRARMGATSDLAALMPEGNKVEWISAPYKRSTREGAAPFWEPNVFDEAVTVSSPAGGVMAFGISLSGLPEEFTNDINVNDLGNGNSDWLCEPFGGYLVCRSLGSFPLKKKIPTVVTMQFHLPAYEVKKYLASASGSRKAYVIVPRQR